MSLRSYSPSPRGGGVTSLPKSSCESGGGGGKGASFVPAPVLPQSLTLFFALSRISLA